MRGMICCTVLLLFGFSGCGRVDPDERLGPVIDGSRNVSISTFFPGGDAPSRILFIRHFYYFSRSSAWSIVSSGDSRPVTLFEEAAVYALRFEGPEQRPSVTRLYRIPNVRTDGVASPRIHIAVTAPLVTNTGIGTPNRDAIVYLEDGPIYGGLDVGGNLDPAFNGDQPARLVVNTRVRAAALASDGRTVAYVDDMGRLYRCQTDGTTAPELLVDIRQRLGPVSVRSVQWEGRSNRRVLVRLDRGGGDEVWASSPDFDTFVHTSNAPETIQEPGSGNISGLDDLTRNITPEEWKVPVPESFE